ncbi:MAG: GNAT family N-acetyltransferase, partial [Actinomycetota bacterium]|nr:GNAT family N-acetyltransferase [Actinomycetota bacterium]
SPLRHHRFRWFDACWRPSCMTVDGVSSVRRAEQADHGAATEVLLRSRHASVPAIPPLAHLDEEVKAHFVGTVMPVAEVWVAEVDNAVSGVLVLNGNWIEQLYIDPDWTNQGLGTALIERAKVECPEVLDLWTFKSNRRAQRFYERHGFRAVGGTNGDNEEGEPDVHYRWAK